jgi:hypothetical protein
MVLATSHPKNKKRFDKWLEAKTNFNHLWTKGLSSQGQQL